VTAGPTFDVPTNAPLPAAVVSTTGVVLPVIERSSAGLVVATPCEHQAVVTAGTLLTSAEVVLDPGDGGPDDPGAIGPGGLTEAAVNLAVVQQARLALERIGVSTALTRSGDYSMTLAARARVVSALHPRLMVSVHHNSMPDVVAADPGTEAYYQASSPQSKRLAGLIYEEVTRALARYKVAWGARRDAGAKYRRSDSGDDYYDELRLSPATPSVVAEPAYVDNPAEAALLAQPTVQRAEGQAVAQAISRFLDTSDPGSGFVTPLPRKGTDTGGLTRARCIEPAL